MAREKFSLITEEERKEAAIRAKIKNGQINPEVYATLPEEEKTMISNILFKMASDRAEPNVGVSTIEFVLMAFIRLTTKKLSGMSLNAEDKEIEAALNRIYSMHQITDGKTPKSEWLFDYLEYAEYNASKLLQNRQEYVKQKMRLLGEV